MEIDSRLFREAGGQPLPDHQRRLMLIQMLPIDISAHVTMHMDLPAHSSYGTLNNLTLRYIRAVKRLKSRSSRTAAAHLVDNGDQLWQQQSEPSEQDEDYDNEHAGLIEQLMNTEDFQERVEILAFMKARGFNTPTHG